MNPLAMLATELDRSLILDLLGFDPLPWQRALLRSTADKVLLNCHRQAGKSSAAAALGVLTALSEPGSLTLIVSASQRQSNELFRKVNAFYKSLGSPIPTVEDNSVTLGLRNGSRIASLPDSIDTIVGYSGPRLIIIDEASRVDDATYFGLRPMLTRSRGRMVCMSTPLGMRGFFHSAWIDRLATWERVEYPVTENPHVDPAWIEEERRLLGPRWFAQEYMCSFEDTISQVFSSETIEAAFDNDLVPMSFGGTL